MLLLPACATYVTILILERYNMTHTPNPSHTHTSRQTTARRRNAFDQLLHSTAGGYVLHVLSTTLFRPSALLAGAICLTIGFFAVYLNARFGGYNLSWAEPLAFFTTGWILGNIFDFLRAMITGKTNKL